MKDGVDWLRQQQPRDLYLTSYDGLRLHARWVPAAQARGTVILFHGWRSSIVGDFSPSMPVYHNLGFNLLLVDQRARMEALVGISPSASGRVRTSGHGLNCTTGSLAHTQCFWGAFPWGPPRF